MMKILYSITLWLRVVWNPMLSVSTWIVIMVEPGKSLILKFSSKLILGGADPDLYVGDMHYHHVTD